MATRYAQLVHDECEYSVVNLDDDTTTVFAGPSILYGVYVNTVLSTHVCPITDASTTVVSLPVDLAAGTSVLYPGIRFETSLIVNPHDSASGSITVAFRRVNADR